MCAVWVWAGALCVAVGAAVRGAGGDDFSFSDNNGLQDALQRHGDVKDSADVMLDARPHRTLIDAERESVCAHVVCGAHSACVVRGGAARCVRPRAHSPRALRPRTRCVGCGRGVAGGGGGGGGGAVCGSDGRTYPSLCRLDLHNCVRAAGAGAGAEVHRAGGEAVRVACSGRCPCGGGGGAGGAECSQLVGRMLAWFRVLRGGVADVHSASSDVEWMFTRLDADGDGVLSGVETRWLWRDRREPCVPALLATCAGAGGGDIRRTDWANCLRTTEPVSDDEDADGDLGSGQHNLLSD